MSTSYVRELLVALGVDGDTKGLEAFDGALEVTIGLMEVAAAAAAALAAAIGAAAGVAAVAVTDTAAYSKEVEQSAAALGLTTDAYQELLYAASQVGLEQEQVGQIFAKLGVQSQGAIEGNEAMAETFAKLGLSVDDLASMDPVALFGALADGFGGITDPAEKAALATALFGDDLARKIIPLLDEGSAGLADMMEEAKKLGIVMSGDTLDAAAEFDDQLGAVEAQLTAIWHTIGVAFLPAAANLLTAVQDWIEAHNELLTQDVPEYLGKIGDVVIDLTDDLVVLVGWVGDVAETFLSWDDIEPMLLRIAAALTTVGIAILSIEAAGVIATGIATLFGLAAPEVVLAAVVLGAALAVVAGWFTAVYLVVQDLYTFLAGGDSVIGRVIDRFEGLDGILTALGGVFQAFGNVAGAVFNLVATDAQTLGIALGAVWTAVQRVLGALGIDLPDAAQFAMGVLDGFAALLNSIADIINGVASAGNDLNNTLVALGGGTGEATATTTPAPANGDVSSVAANNAAAFTASSAAAPTPLSAPATATGGGGSSLRTGDVNVTVQGAGWTEEQVTTLVNSVVETHLRDAMTAYGGG